MSVIKFFEEKLWPFFEYVYIITLLVCLSGGLITEFVWELPARMFVIWFTLSLFGWSFLAMRQMKKAKSEKDTLYAIVGILLAIWYTTKMITLKEKQIGNFAANCRKEELIVGTIVPVSVAIYASGYFLSSL